MKALSSLAIAVAIALSSVSGAAYAAPSTEQNSTFNFTPPGCAAPATKSAHPDWYRIGGYCDPYDSDSH